MNQIDYSNLMKGLTEEIDLSGISSSDGISIAITTASHDADGDINDEGVTYSDDFCLSEESNINDNIYRWLIGVYAAEDSGIEVFNSFDFTILAKTDNPFVTLQDGVTIDASIDTKSTFAYYQFYAN